jgi:hypothetical protein
LAPPNQNHPEGLKMLPSMLHPSKDTTIHHPNCEFQLLLLISLLAASAVVYQSTSFRDPRNKNNAKNREINSGDGLDARRASQHIPFKVQELFGAPWCCFL